MKAIERVVEDQVRTNKEEWEKVLLGQVAITVDPKKYNMTMKTLQQQANERGLRTLITGDLIKIFK